MFMATQRLYQDSRSNWKQQQGIIQFAIISIKIAFCQLLQIVKQISSISMRSEAESKKVTANRPSKHQK